MCFFGSQAVTQHLQINQPRDEQVAVLQIDPGPLLGRVLDHLRGLGALALCGLIPSRHGLMKTPAPPPDQVQVHFSRRVTDLAQAQRLDLLVELHLAAEDVEGLGRVATLAQNKY